MVPEDSAFEFNVDVADSLSKGKNLFCIVPNMAVDGGKVIRIFTQAIIY